MKITAGSGTASILMRRVRRHARLATLWQPREIEPGRFTSPLDAPQPAPPLEDIQPEDAVPAMAQNVAAPPTGPALPTLPASQATVPQPAAQIQSAPAHPTATGWPARASSGEPPAAQAALLPASSSPEPPAALPPLPVQRQPIQPAHPREEAKSEPPTADLNWQRLQNILHAHHAKQALESSTGVALPGQPIQQRAQSQGAAQKAAQAATSMEITQDIPTSTESGAWVEKSESADSPSSGEATELIETPASVETPTSREAPDSPSGITNPPALPGATARQIPGRSIPSAPLPRRISELSAPQAAAPAAQTIPEASPPAQPSNAPGNTIQAAASEGMRPGADRSPAPQTPPEGSQMLPQPKPQAGERSAAEDEAAILPLEVTLPEAKSLPTAEAPAIAKDLPLAKIQPEAETLARVETTLFEEPPTHPVERSEPASRIPAGEPAPQAPIQPAGSDSPPPTREAMTSNMLQPAATASSPGRTALSSEEPLEAHLAPLEVAWPVQRLRDSSVHQGGDREEELPGEPEQAGAFPARSAPGGQASAEVQPAPVEILPPRGPRPGAVQAARIQPSEPALKEDRAPLETSTPARSSDAPAMVPTEIGPLPADLWTIIGETPPAHPQAAAENRPSAQDRTFNAGLSPTPSSASPALIQGHDVPGAETATSVVQALSAPPPAEGETAEQPPAGEGQSNQPSAPDLTKLVQQVYAEVRRRLSIEWERNRR
jgi:hypothetical protein